MPSALLRGTTQVRRGAGFVYRGRVIVPNAGAVYRVIDNPVAYLLGTYRGAIMQFDEIKPLRISPGGNVLSRVVIVPLHEGDLVSSATFDGVVSVVGSADASDYFTDDNVEPTGVAVTYGGTEYAAGKGVSFDMEVADDCPDGDYYLNFSYATDLGENLTFRKLCRVGKLPVEEDVYIG